MEERRAQIASYLRSTVSPFITPLMEQITKKRPKDLLKFTKDYNANASQSQKSDQEQQQINRKFQQRLKQKKNNGKKLSRQGISAQVYGTFNQKKQFVPNVIQKSSKTKQIIRGLLKQSVLFKTLPDQDMNIVIDAMSSQNKKVGEQIIRQGDQGQVLYIVGSGQYQCHKMINGKQTYLKSYKVGQYFGQLALMYTSPRAASIKCSKQGTIYGLDRQTFKYIVQQAANKRRQKFRKILSKVSILSQIDPYQKQQLCDILKQQTYNEGQYIVRQGQEGDKFYLVAEGKLSAQKDGKLVYKFSQGDYFGQIALVRNTPRQASVRCQTKTKVVWIDRDSFKRMFGPIEEILKRNEQKYKQYISD